MSNQTAILKESGLAMPQEELTLIQPGQVRVRIAPSPTGPFHLGNARTALFNYLFSRKHQGIFVLRIEDTDKERSTKQWEQGILDSLKWLGLDWQEGPYRQSERKAIYQKHIEKLLEKKKLYHCFCSKEELEAQRQYLMSIGKPSRYSGKCLQLSAKQVKEKLEQGKGYVLRFKAPLKKVVFEDMLRGEIENHSDNFGDFVAAKSSSEPLYNLACVIDDFEMKISHVIRGEDHIPNTPKQILLAEALGIQIPQYLHLSMILGPDRAKLSKRHGATFVPEYKKEGYLAEAVINFLAFLGWNPGTDKEIFSINALVKTFSVEGLQKSGAVFNIKKLDWLNGFYLRQKSLDKLAELCLPYLQTAGLVKPGDDLALVRKAVGLYQERLKKLSEISELVDFFFQEPEYDKALLFWKDNKEKETKKALDKAEKVLKKLKVGEWTKEKINQLLMEEAEPTDRGKLLWPLRAALSGKKASASPFEIAEVLGKEKTLERIKQAKKKL